jgi:hypothetical protein
MATIEVCDLCGKQEGVERMYFTTGTEADASGCGRNDIGEHFDLCGKDAMLLLGYVISTLPNKYSVGEACIKWVKKKQKFVANR